MKTFLLILAAAVAVCADGCSKHDDTSTASSIASDAARGSGPNTAPDANASIAPEETPSGDATGTTTSDAGTTVTTGSHVKVDAPLYPGASVGSPSDVETTENGIRNSLVMLSSSDPFDTVDAWYKSHTAGYTPSHMSMMKFEESKYVSGSTDALPMKSILITTNKGRRDGTQTHIVIRLKEKAP